MRSKKKLTPTLKRAIWLTTLPIAEHGFALHKGAIRDALCLWRHGANNNNSLQETSSTHLRETQPAVQHNTSLDEMPPEPVPHQICHHVPPWNKVHLPPPNLLRGLNGCGLLRRPHLYPGLNNSNQYNILFWFVLPFFCFVYVRKYL